MSKTLTFAITDDRLHLSASYTVRGEVGHLSDQEAKQLVAILRTYQHMGRSPFKFAANLVTLFREMVEASNKAEGAQTYTELLRGVREIRGVLQSFSSSSPAKVIEMLALFKDQTEEEFVENLMNSIQESPHD